MGIGLDGGNILLGEFDLVCISVETNRLIPFQSNAAERSQRTCSLSSVRSPRSDQRIISLKKSYS